VLEIAKKVAEEGAETALAAVAEPERLAAESADLLYHLAVLWRAAGLRSEDVAAELSARRR
jgi:phosphoribosyl-ATP pyrophosphohydrolase